MSHDHCSFTSGWLKALELFKAGTTWEAITHMADAEPPTFGRGMVAGVDAMSGWLDCARREAKAHSIPEARIEELIRRCVALGDEDDHSSAD